MAKKRIYTKTGCCIWCGRIFPDVSFTTIPHILPQSLGGEEIGVDICDDCNHYFGTAQPGKPNIDLVFKEIFNAYRFFSANLTINSYKQFHSIFFSYRHNQRKVIIKPSFRSAIITRQFKRGLYNVFLQKYHSLTGDGNNPKFKMVRDFARYDIGTPRVYYAFNNIILSPSDKSHPNLPMTQKTINEIDEYGACRFWCIGHCFYLEILPLTFNLKGRQFLQEEANTMLIHAKGDERIFEFNDIMEIDFLMQRFGS